MEMEVEDVYFGTKKCPMCTHTCSSWYTLPTSFLKTPHRTLLGSSRVDLPTYPEMCLLPSLNHCFLFRSWQLVQFPLWAFTSVCFIQWNHTTSGFLCLVSFTRHVFKAHSSVAGLAPFLWLNNIPQYEQTPGFPHSPTNRHLGCFHLWIIVIYAAMNLHVHVFKYLFIFNLL